MLPTNDDIGTMDSSATPDIQAKSLEHRELMSPVSNSDSDPQTVTKPKRKRRKGNNWTHKKHTLRSPALTSDVSPTASPEIKQEGDKDTKRLEEKDPEVVRDMYNDSIMDFRRAAVEQDFGLRPDLGITDRPKVPIKSIEETGSMLSEKSPLPVSTEPPRIAPRKEVCSILPTPETPKQDHSPATSSTDHRKEITSSLSDDPTRTSDGSPIIPPHFPPNPDSRSDRAGDLLWLQACMQVQRPDGTVHAPEVIVWLMTRKGGKKSSWPRLKAGLAEVKMMGKVKIDPADILRRQEEEDAIARAKEERRLANKLRYRPRGQIDRERADRRAALASQKAQESERGGTDDTYQEDHVDDPKDNRAQNANMNKI
ncbi:hypothetical protein FPOA_00321 [Fusarium poae]|uniref:Uncharacterized protein n=1 Tax=Fusarium poae TaxID=36050 RepID=A0A1B8B0X1_FUSPO|nr:hypothetical protein FPOA_00321 [Fusarium poae]